MHLLPSAWQVSDGMGLSAEGSIAIEVAHVNAPPQPACESLDGGLFDDEDLLRSLRGLTSTAPASFVSREAATGLMIASRDVAIGEDPSRSSLRTQALERLTALAEEGAVVSGKSAFDLACSADGVWEMRMVPGVESSAAGEQQALSVSLLAFDRDGALGTTYKLLSPPTRGTLFATSALPQERHPEVRKGAWHWLFPMCHRVSLSNPTVANLCSWHEQAEARTFLEIGKKLHTVRRLVCPADCLPAGLPLQMLIPAVICSTRHRRAW